MLGPTFVYLPYCRTVTRVGVNKVILYVDTYFWGRLAKRENHVLLVRLQPPGQPYRGQDEGILLKPRLHDIRQALKQLVKLHYELSRGLLRESIDHARRVGRFRLRNILFIPTPLRYIDSIDEKQLREMVSYKLLLDDIFGTKKPVDEVEVEHHELIHYTFKLRKHPPYLYSLSDEPDPAYSILYRVDEGFRREIESIAREIFSKSTS